MSLRVVAIDWSGDARHPERKIWVAEVVAGELVDVRQGATAPAMANQLIDLARQGPLIVGLDFAFSFPRWFGREELGATDVERVWDAVAAHGENWLAACEPPFWGRPGRKRPPEDASRPMLRRTDDQTPFSAKSVFQIGGAGAVGTGSIRGMPLLTSLRRAGFAIWPFDDAAEPVALEIYPRILTRGVVKSDAAARTQYVKQDGRIPDRLTDIVVSEEDPFDAAISALEMSRYSEELLGLTQEEDYSMEGAIWQPRWSPERRYLDPGLPDGWFVLDYPDGSGEGPFSREHVAEDPDGTAYVRAEAGTPRVLRVVDSVDGWQISLDGGGKRWRFRARPWDEGR